MFKSGMIENNLRIGCSANVRLPIFVESAELHGPEETRNTIPVRNGGAAIHARKPGLYRLACDGAELKFSVSAISRSESDLSGLVTGKWGEWKEIEIFGDEYRSINWILVLFAIGVLAIHQMAVFRMKGGAGV